MLGDKCKKINHGLASPKQNKTFIQLHMLGMMIDEITDEIDTMVTKGNFGGALGKYNKKTEMQKSLIAKLKTEIEKQRKQNEPVPPTEPKREKQNTL